MQFLSLHNIRSIKADACHGRVTGSVCLVIDVVDANGTSTEIKIFDVQLPHAERIADAINQRELELETV